MFSISIAKINSSSNHPRFTIGTGNYILISLSALCVYDVRTQQIKNQYIS